MPSDSEWSRSAWSAWSLLPLCVLCLPPQAWHVRRGKRRQAGRAPNASRYAWVKRSVAVYKIFDEVWKFAVAADRVSMIAEIFDQLYQSLLRRGVGQDAAV
jgi:hypothetical protein